MTVTLEEFLNEQITEKLENAALSGSRSQEKPQKIRIRPVQVRGQVLFQQSWTCGTQAFQKNCTREETIAFLTDALGRDYRQLQTRTAAVEGTVLAGKKGKCTIRQRPRKEKEGETPSPRILSHNRVRQYLLQEGVPVPFLIDLGVMTRDGKVHAARYDKFRQVNRFLEFVEDILPALPEDREITILDFGCGKSYLTFALYYYLHELRGRDIRIIGLDLKEDVIRKCNAHAKEYGYDRLQFLQFLKICFSREYLRLGHEQFGLFPHDPSAEYESASNLQLAGDKRSIVPCKLDTARRIVHTKIDYRKT